MDNQLSNPEIGRVLRASTVGFAVGCQVSQLSVPAFGSLVRAQPVDARDAIYGLIYDMHIDDDPLVRRLVLAENPDPELINDQRRNRMLPIEMSILAVGYMLNGQVRYGLPPRPPLNLDPVQLCADPAERAADSNVPVDQLLVAHITTAYEIRGEDTVWVLRVMTELIELLRSDYNVLIPTLEALSEALPGLPVNAAELLA
jgi:hypothetical protein